MFRGELLQHHTGAWCCLASAAHFPTVGGTKRASRVLARAQGSHEGADTVLPRYDKYFFVTTVLRYLGMQETNDLQPAADQH